MSSCNGMTAGELVRRLLDLNEGQFMLPVKASTQHQSGTLVAVHVRADKVWLELE